MKIKITKNGPYLVDAGIPLKEVNTATNREGNVIAYAEEKDHGLTNAVTALCRCGHSANKPFCDGHHAQVGFDGTELNNRQNYDDEAEFVQGAIYDALDYRALCAVARFCDAGTGFWGALDRADETGKKYAEFVGCNCSSGRLTLVDKHSGQKLEPKLEQEICAIKDIPARHLGPLYVKGGIPVIGVDGFEYEVRNRMTLCCCGESNNKPFCDASHLNCPHMEIK